MKRKIGAPKGRQLYGAPKGALIMPNMVCSAYTMKLKEYFTFIFDKTKPKLLYKNTFSQ